MGIRGSIVLAIPVAVLLTLAAIVTCRPIVAAAAAAHGPSRTGWETNAQGGTFLPSPLDFGNVTVGTTVTLTLLFRNTGDVKLNFNRSSGPNPDNGDTSGFNATDTALCRNVNLFPTEQCSMQITFTALAPGLVTRTLTLHDEFTTGTSYEVELRGTGVSDSPAPTLTVASASGPYRGFADLAATLSGCTGSLGGHAIVFTLATPAGSRSLAPTTGASGTATVSAASLAVDTASGLAPIPAGTYGPSGGYGVLASFVGDASCGAASGAAVLVVTRLAPTITFVDPGARTYGDAPFPLSVSSSADPDPAAPPLVLAYDTPGVCSGPTALPAAVTIHSAGICTITATQPAAGNPNYDDASPSSRTIAVGKATPSITWPTPAAIGYGTALSDTQLNASSTVPGSFAYSPMAGVVPGAGTPTLSVTFTPSDTANYESAVATVQLLVTPAPLTVTAGNATREYGADNLSFTATYSGFVNGEDKAALGGSLIFTASATTASPVGDYPITPGGLTATNYVITFTPGTLTITAVSLTIRADDTTREYGASNPTFTATYTGFVGADGPGVLTGALLCTTSAEVTSLPAPYTITCGGLTATNYTLSFVPGTLTVTTATVTLAVPPVALTWGASSATLVANLSAGTTVSGGTVGFDLMRGVTVVGSTSATVSGGVASALVDLAGFDADTYTITASYSGTVAFKVASGGGVLDLTRVTQTITFDPLPGRIYGDPAFDLVATASSGLPVSFVVPAGGPCTLSGVTLTIVGIGTCTVTATQAGDVNHAAAPDEVRSFAITRAMPVLTWNAPAPIVYGTALSATQLNAAASVPGSFAYDPPVGTVLGAGASRMLSVTFTPTDDATYATATKSILLAVNAAPLIVTTASATKVYGAALPTFGVGYSGFVNGENTGVLAGTLTFTTSATSASPVGDYPVTPGGLTSVNYNVSFAAGTLAITPAALTITANGQSRAYGSPNPPLTAAYSGFVNNETASALAGTLSCTTTATASSGPGPYPISCGGQTSTNYTLAYVGGTLTVSTAPLTITANAQARAFGASNPPLTASYVGFANGEGVGALAGTLACATTATPASPTGPYPITCTGHSSLNYAIAYRPGTLTITSATSATTPSSVTTTYGAASINVPVAVTASGAVNEGIVTVQIRRGEIVFVTGVSGTVTNGATSATIPLDGLDAGDFTLAATYIGTGNLLLSTGSATLTINKADQAITFGPLPDRMLGDLPFVLRATASSGLPVSFTAAPGASCTVADATVTLLAGGTCTITARQGGDKNHNAAPDMPRSFQISGGTSASPSPSPSLSPSPITSPSPSPSPSPPGNPSSQPSPSPVASPSPSPGSASFTLALTISGDGSATPAVPGPTYPAGTKVALAATPAAGHIFLGWTVDGQFQGWNTSLSVTMHADRAVTATFAPRPAYCDISPGMASDEAIAHLAAQGIIKGYGDGCYGPDDAILRAQMAGLIVRAMGWTGAPGAPQSFADQGDVDAELWRAVGILAARGVARGYEDGTYRPLDPVLHIQAISFITRAMVARGYWQPQPDDGTRYPDVPAASGHRQDLATFVYYAGLIPGTSPVTPWVGPEGWDQPATRAWFARLLWQALDSYFGAARED